MRVLNSVTCEGAGAVNEWVGGCHLRPASSFGKVFLKAVAAVDQGCLGFVWSVGASWCQFWVCCWFFGCGGEEGGHPLRRRGRCHLCCCLSHRSLLLLLSAASNAAAAAGERQCECVGWRREPE